MGSLSTQNQLLQTLDPADLAFLKPYFEDVFLPLQHVLENPNKPIENAYFLEGGIASIVANLEGKQIEVGIIGREGMVGHILSQGVDHSPFETFMQGEATAKKISAADLRIAFQKRPAIQQHFLYYARAFSIQISYTALTNAVALLQERMARWLLMTQDRMGTSSVSLTHQFLSLMLGVRRSGVTDAIHQLEGAGLIKGTRGCIEIRDRKGLEKLAGDHYGPSEREFKELLGYFPGQS
ncbi:MAG: Crp/Fnr family transcriptional regulator [Pseudomonadota bacterium]